MVACAQAHVAQATIILAQRHWAAYVETTAKDTKDQIYAQKVKILKNVTEKLDERAEKLVQDVDKVYGELHGQLTKQHGEIKDHLDKVQTSVSLSRNLLKRGSIEEILSSQKVSVKYCHLLGMHDQKPTDCGRNLGKD